MGIFSKIGLGIYYRIRRMNKALKNWRKFGVIMFGGLMLTAMSGVGTGITSDQILTTTQVAPSGVILAQNATKQFSASSMDQTGQPITSGVTYTWKVMNNAAGSISGTGLFTAGQTAGEYTNAIKLTAVKGGSTKYSYATVTVQGGGGGGEEQLVLTTITMSPTGAIMAKGATKQFVPYAYDQKGNPMSGVTFTWKATAGGSISGTGLFTAGQTAGEYTNAIKLTGSKNGSIKYAYGSVTVQQGQEVNQPPVARITANPTSGVDSLTSNLNASTSTDSDGTIVKYEWDYDGNGTYDYNSGNDSTVSHTYSVGTWTPRVRVTDNDGATDVASVATSITVTETPQVNQPPVARITASPVSGVVSLASNLNASTSTDPDGTIVKYEWDYDGNGTYDYNSGNDSTVSHTYGIGTWYPKVRVTDNDGATDVAAVSTAIVVTEQPQEDALAYVVVTPPIKYLDYYESYQFTATAYDQDNNQISDSLVDYYWSEVNGGGSINHSNGTFTAGNDDGTFDHTVRVRAIMNGVTKYAYATVVVNPITTQAVLDRVEILPSSITIDRYANYDFTAYAYDTNNVQMYSDVTYTWEVVAGPGSVNQNGLYTATGSENTATVQVEARQGSIKVYDTALVYIRNGNNSCSGILDRVVITPSTGYVQTGHSIDFDAQAYDTTGCLVSTDLYFSLNGNVPGSINNSGYFTANYTTGTYNDGVKVRAYKDGHEVYDWATVIISDNGNNQNYYIDSSLRAYDETISSDYKANEGDTVLYTLKLTNNRSNALTGVKATMEVPDYTTFVSVSASNGTPSISGRTITWDLGSLSIGETKTMWVRVRVKDGVPSNTVIRGKALVKAYEISNGFWVNANDLQVNGTGAYNPIEPLTPSGAMEWILAAITALLATIFTRQLMKTRELLTTIK